MFAYLLFQDQLDRISVTGFRLVHQRKDYTIFISDVYLQMFINMALIDDKRFPRRYRYTSSVIDMCLTLLSSSTQVLVKNINYITYLNSRTDLEVL